MTNICSIRDETLAEKLRRENYDQFNILVRMHLSFVLDLTTDENEALVDRGKLRKWSLVPFKKSKCRGIMEGAPLTQEGICQVYQLIEFLKREPNICQEGIFRRTGSLNRQQDLRSLLNQGTTLGLDDGPYSVHDCASVLKGFLADLPEPLLSEAHYPAYCQISELCGDLSTRTQEDRMLQAQQLLLLLLPSENRVLFRDVLDLLHLTASYESRNKMSAESLATLFTPHLLCPRKLSPETLHSDSRTLPGIIAFMIKHSAELFEIPRKLAVDIRAYLEDRDRRRALSPTKMFNDSVSDTANTVFSFVDLERTAKENQSNPTETALAQLYAHIQSLPESSKKRKLVKQFNKENGNGTPLQVLRSGGQKNRTLCDSIKKNFLHKCLIKSVKKSTFLSQRSRSSEELLNSPQMSTARSTLFCGDSPSFEEKLCVFAAENALGEDNECFKRSFSESDLSTDNYAPRDYLTSTPACRPSRDVPDIVFACTPEDRNRKSMSPITRSTQRMCRDMQETMMTPRSRKPVLLVSGTNINNLSTLDKQNLMDKVPEEDDADIAQADETKEDDGKCLTNEFRQYLHSRGLLSTSAASPTDLSFSSRTDDYSSTNVNDLDESKMILSLLDFMEENPPPEEENREHHLNDSGEVKQLVLKPKQFNEQGEPIIYETSF